MKDKVICLNRAASHEYFILERIEAGIALDGGEVKSLRMGNCNLRDSFCSVHNGEMLIRNIFISVYDKATAFNEKNARRDRKLLLHRTEILKLKEKVEQKGLTLVPLKMYFKNALIKIELGLCRGKHTYDKKQSLKEKDLNREKERIMKNY